MLGAAALTLLLVAVAVTAAMCGFLAAVAVLRNNRRTRGSFLLGILTGLVAAKVTRARSRRLSALDALARRLGGPHTTRQRHTGLWQELLATYRPRF